MSLQRLFCPKPKDIFLTWWNPHNLGPINVWHQFSGNHYISVCSLPVVTFFLHWESHQITPVLNSTSQYLIHGLLVCWGFSIFVIVNRWCQPLDVFIVLLIYGVSGAAWLKVCGYLEGSVFCCFIDFCVKSRLLVSVWIVILLSLQDDWGWS